jgi:hypothetical protein
MRKQLMIIDGYCNIEGMNPKTLVSTFSQRRTPIKLDNLLYMYRLMIIQEKMVMIGKLTIFNKDQ